MSRYILEDDYGMEIAKFETKAGAYDYANNNGYADEPFSLKDTETGVVSVSLVLPADDIKRIKKAAELLGLTDEEFIIKSLNDFLQRKKTDVQVKPQYGQVWKYKDSSDLYIIGEFEMSSCTYPVLITLKNGHVGPIWETMEAMTEDMEFIADSVHECYRVLDDLCEDFDDD